MFTFIESFYNTDFHYTSGVAALKQYILDMLNTDRGTRPYYPDYGCLVEKYKYSLLNLQTAQNIHSDVYYQIASMSNIQIINTNYKLKIAEKKVELYFDLLLGQEPIGIHLTYSDGGFK